MCTCQPAIEYIDNMVPHMGSVSAVVHIRMIAPAPRRFHVHEYACINIFHSVVLYFNETCPIASQQYSGTECVCVRVL